MAEINALELAREVESYVIKMRRDFHENPEASGTEERTIHIVKSELESMVIETEVIKSGGVIGILNGSLTGKTLILRSDMDALPMKEDENNLKGLKGCISKSNRAAHTCGHDAHMAMLLGAAKLLSQNRDKIRGKIIFAFEQGEENGFGILGMLNRLLEIGADGIWAIHTQSEVPSGKISIDPGPRMAGVIPFAVSIKGKGGHGSRPDLANSPLDCFTDIYKNLTVMRLNNLNPFDPLTLSIGQVQMGTMANIIPEELIFAGTMRFLNYERSGAVAVSQFLNIVEKICKLHECTYEYLRKPMTADVLVYNNEDCTKIASRAVEKALGKEALYKADAWMASETMAAYLKFFPGIFAFLGILNEEKGVGAGHHNPKFDIDEDILKLGVASTFQYALEFLNSDESISFNPSRKSPYDLMREAGLI